MRCEQQFAPPHDRIPTISEAFFLVYAVRCRRPPPLEMGRSSFQQPDQANPVIFSSLSLLPLDKVNKARRFSRRKLNPPCRFLWSAQEARFSLKELLFSVFSATCRQALVSDGTAAPRKKLPAADRAVSTVQRSLRPPPCSVIPAWHSPGKQEQFLSRRLPSGSRLPPLKVSSSKYSPRETASVSGVHGVSEADI